MLKLVKYTITLINQPKKSLIDKISKRLLELQFKSDHSIKSKFLKRVVKKFFPSL